MDSYYSVGQPN